MAENLKIPASVDLEIRQAEAKAKVLADKVSASFQKIKIGGFDSSGLKAGSAALGRIRQDADQFTKSMEAANARVLAFGTAVGVIEGMRRSFLALVKTTVDVEKALTQISVVAGDNFTKAGISIEQFGKQIFQTAKLTGQSFETTSKAALEFSRQGLGVQESLKRTRDALILSRISGVEYKTAVDGLTSTLNAFKQSGIDSTTVINKLVAVDNAAAVSLIDLIEGLQRSASVAQLTGQNIDQTIASIATLQEITARGGSQIGNSLKSIFTRLYDEDSIKFLETFQGGVIKVRDEVGNLIPAIEIMRNLGNAIKDLPKEQQLNIFKDISGLYQVNAAAALAGQGLQELNKQKAIYDKNLATSQGAKDNALSANATLAEILSSKFNTLGVQLEEILNSAGKIGVANPLSGLLDSVSEAGDFIQSILEGTDKFSQTIQGIGRFLGGSLFSPAVFGAIAIAIGKIGVNFASFAVNAGKTFLGLNKASQEQAAIQKSIAAYIQQSGANLSSLLTSESARLNLAKQISAEWAKQAVYSKQVSSVAQVVAGSVYGSGLRVGESGPTLAKRGLRSAEGYLPDLISGEMNDIRKGVGGASSNSKVVVMPNFPLGGGNKGLMVANSSESVVNLGGGKFGVLNQDMMGQRAASGINVPDVIRGSRGRFQKSSDVLGSATIPAIESLVQLLVSAGKSAFEINSSLQAFVGNMNLQGDLYKMLVKEANAYARALEKIDASSKISSLERMKSTSGASSSSFGASDRIRLQKEAEQMAINAVASSMGQANNASAQFIPYLGLGFSGKTSAKQSSAFGSFAPRYNTASNFRSNPRGFGYGAFGSLNEMQAQSVYAGGQTFPSRFENDRRLRQNRGDFYRKINQEKIASGDFSAYSSNRSAIAKRDAELARQKALIERLKSSRESGGIFAAPSTRLVGGVSSPMFGGTKMASTPLPKASTIDKEALQTLAIRAVLVTSALEGLSAAFLRGSKDGEKYADAISKISMLGFAFQGLNQLGGTNISSLIGGGGSSGKIGGFLKGLGGKASQSKLGSASIGAVAEIGGAVLNLGKGFIRIVPVLGQVALAFAAVNEVVKVFTGSSIIDRFSETLGFLTDSAEQAKQKFNEIGQTLFSPEGEYSGRDEKSRIESVKALQELTKQRILASKENVSSSGKNAGEIAASRFENRILQSLGSVGTGGSKIVNQFSSGVAPSMAYYGQTVGRQSVVSETFRDISTSSQEVIKLGILDAVSGTTDELKSKLQSLGIQKIGQKEIKDAGLEELQSTLANEFLKKFRDAFEDFASGTAFGGSFDDFLKGDQGQLLFGKFTENFIKGKSVAQTPTSQPSGVFGAGNFSEESIQKFLEVQKEIELLAFDASAANIESQIKSLESSLSGSTLSSLNKNILEEQIAGFQSFVLANSLAKLRAEAEVSIGKVNADKELDPLQKSGKIQQINAQLSVEETKIKSDIKSISDSTLARNKEFAAIQKLVPIIDAASSSISRLELVGVKNQANIDLLEAQSQNPALTTIQRENFQREINAKRQFDIQNQIELTKQSAIESKARLPLSEDRDKLEKRIDEDAEKTITALEGQAVALKEATSQIGQFGNAAQKFADSILEFERSLGESRAQNQFNLLQATDKSSIVSGLISEQSFDAVAGKSGTDLVSSLSEQNAIRQQQFDIATAASRVERLNLETELELNQQIFAIRNSDLSSAEKQLAIENAINANLEKRRTFGFGVRESLSGMQDEVNNFGATFGQTATEGFRDGLVSAMQVAVSQTGNLKEALLDVALAFTNKLRDAALTNLANVLVSGSKGGGGGGWGGIISSVLGAFSGQKMASGGSVTGGSGVKDDVPTLLMGGEYVVNKKAVNTYGKSFFEALNNRSVGKMAQGGYFAPGVRGQGNITGKDNLLDFATQTATFGGQDVRRSLMGGAGMVSLEPESLRLSNFNRFGDSPIVQATQEAKDQAFGLYTDQLGQEKQYQEELADYYRQLEEARAAQKRAEKDKKKQFLISLATAVVGAGISYGMGGGAKSSAKSGETKFSGGKIRGVSERPFSAAKSGLPRSSNSSSFSSTISDFADIQPLGSSQFDWREMIRQINANVANKSFTNYDLGINRGGSYGSSLLLPPTSYTPYGRNSGGAISGSGDVVPIMASKGERMINSQAVNKLGHSTLDLINRGFMPSGESDSSAVVARLDELIEKTMGTSNVTVNVTVSKDGEQSSQEGGGDQGNKMLAEKLRGAVIQVIQSEQRPGGILSKR